MTLSGKAFRDSHALKSFELEEASIRGPGQAMYSPKHRMHHHEPE